jgi:type VI secretion system protein VasD
MRFLELFSSMRLLPAIGALFAIACSSSQPPPPEAPAKPEKCVEPRARVTITASEQVNAGPDGRGLPVQVRLYQLKSEAKLMNAFFEEVWNDDAKTLEGDLLGKRELTAFPGKSQEVVLEPMPEGRVLGAVALFREPRGRDWYVNYDLPLPAQEPPCPPAEPRISIWLDRMKIQDGEGRVEAAGGAPRGEAAPSSSDRDSSGEGN